jgi:hypothetical protein
MEVSQFTKVEFASTIYVGGALDPYFSSVVELTNLRSISPIDSTQKTELLPVWGSAVEQPYEVPVEPQEAEFIVNLNRNLWKANQPLPNLWKDKRDRACRITYKTSALDTGFQLKFVCRPASWSLSPSLSDATLLRCSILIVSVVEPEIL